MVSLFFSQFFSFQEQSDLEAWAAVANGHEQRVKALTGATQLLAVAE